MKPIMYCFMDYKIWIIKYMLSNIYLVVFNFVAFSYKTEINNYLFLIFKIWTSEASVDPNGNKCSEYK